MRVMARAQQPATLFDWGGDRKSDEVVQASPRSLNAGDNAEYQTARIARDRPDILERMQAGAYKSVRALARRCTADASARPLFFQVAKRLRACCDTAARCFADRATVPAKRVDRRP